MGMIKLLRRFTREITRLDEILNIDLEPTEQARVVAVRGPWETGFGTVRASVEIDSMPGIFVARGDVPTVGEIVTVHMPVDDYWYVTASVTKLGEQSEP